MNVRSGMLPANLLRSASFFMMEDFHRAVQLKRELATKDLTDQERAKLQGEYNDVLNKYFEIRQPAPAAKAATKG